MNLLESYGIFDIIAFNVIPAVFVYLWYLILGDLKNFKASGESCRECIAQDPINCYQNDQSQ